MPVSRQAGDWIVDRFEVFEVHQGGMGVVYVARDRLASERRRLVALKTLHDELLVDPHRRERFATECHLWVHLGRHPNIVQAYSVEEIEERLYIVLELVTGGELRRRIGTPALDPIRALRYGVEFCVGMEHAIRQGLRCHRDIKPGNLLITDADVLKITDFGLAGVRDEILADASESLDDPIPLVESGAPQRIVWSDPRDGVGPEDPSGSDDASTARQTGISNVESTVDIPRNVPAVGSNRSGSHLDSTIEYVRANPVLPFDVSLSRLTHTGALIGTLPYMAPEQFRDAKAADVRADIYSFGVVLFQMLTTELPFKGDTVAKLNHQHSHQSPPSVIPSIPRRFSREAERIDGIVQRCLAKDPGDRYDTIAGLRQSLTAVLRRLDRRFDPRR